jgi:hypothetical protein
MAFGDNLQTGAAAGGYFRYPLTQRARNRLATVMKSGPRAFETFPSLVALDALEQLQVNETLPRFLIVLLGEPDGDNPVKDIEIPQADAFMATAVGAALAGSASGWLLNMGLGGSERMPSWRLIEQVAPILEAALRLQRAGFGSPRLQIFKANQLAQRVNRLDPHMVAVSSIATMIFIDAYVSDLYPSLRPLLELEEDDEDWLDAIHPFLERLARSIPEDSDMAKLSRSRSSVLDGMVYGLAHAFQLQHVSGRHEADRMIWSSGNDRGVPSAVVTFGGAPERLFANIIRKAVDAAPVERFEKPPSVRLITRLCRKPAYLPMADETSIARVPTLKEMRIQAAIPEIAEDWKRLNKRHGLTSRWQAAREPLRSRDSRLQSSARPGSRRKAVGKGRPERNQRR